MIAATKRATSRRFLSLAKFQVVVFAQHVMLLLDVLINSFGELVGRRNVHFLILYM